MMCVEKSALFQAFRAAVKQFRAVAKDRDLSGAQRDEKLDDAHADCERRRGALGMHREEHGC